MEASVFAGGVTDAEVVAAAGVSLAVAVFVMAVLRWEAELPFVVSLLFVPFIVGLGFLLGVVIRTMFALTMLQSAGVLAALLVVVVGAYEGMRMVASDPHPPTMRF